MALHIRNISAVATGTALLGLAAYAVYRSGVLRPVLVGGIRGGMKAADWVGKKAACVKLGVEGMVAEAKAAQKKPAAKAAAKPKPAAKPVSAPAA